MKISDLKSAKHIHFIGIGGIGVSAIARMMVLQGKKVSGSDRDESEITKELSKMGVEVFIGQRAENILPDTNLVIYTIAIPEDNPELAHARSLGLKCISYPESLGLISEEKFTIAVSGTHGKTTTTAMIAKIMVDAKLDPTVVVGSIVKDNKSNFIAGKSKYIVIEACEYKRSFLNYSPDILVITNIDDDHLDYYKDIEDIKSAFSELVRKIPSKGYLVASGDQENVLDVIRKAKCNIVDYEVFGDQNLELKVPGDHNLANAAAALAVADILGISRKSAEKSLSEFSGTWRRSEYKGTLSSGALIYDDYAHHPTEIKATLKGFRQLFRDKRITVVFQPHLYSRTKDHLKEFGEAFSDADAVIVAPVYGAREKPDPSISADSVAFEIVENGGRASALPNEVSIESQLRQDLSSDKDLLITMGAGDVYLIGEKLLGSKEK